MRTTQYLTAKHRINVITPAGAGPVQCLETSAERVASVMDALDDVGSLISNRCFSHPDALTQDNITAYALALMRLRECACAAGLGRLTKACDALAVTVARLIDDKNCACHNKCEALTRFVTHAHAMLQLSADTSNPHTPPVGAAHTLADKAIIGAGRPSSLRARH
ncbi:MAG: hypothetical protein Q8K62_11835 [Thiobacillus sp.]|nr:hypothetical protein [Thiobacillus sp.]